MKVWYVNTLLSIFLIDFADLICDDFFLAFDNVWQLKLTLKEVVHEKFTSFEPLELSLLRSNLHLSRLSVSHNFDTNSLSHPIKNMIKLVKITLYKVDMYACLCHYGFSSLVPLILQNKKEKNRMQKIFFL